MLQLAIKAGRRHIPIFDLPAAMGRREAYQEIGDQVDALIAFLDDLQGDVDLEDGNDNEPDGDAMGDQAWPEWHTLPAAQRRSGNSRGKVLPTVWFTSQEDDEDSDTSEEDDHSGGDVLDMEMDEDAITLRPIYGVDQDQRPLNVLTANQRYDVAKQIAIHVDGGDPKWVKQLRARLVTLQQREAAMIRAGRSNDN